MPANKETIEKNKKKMNKQKCKRGRQKENMQTCMKKKQIAIKHVIMQTCQTEK